MRIKVNNCAYCGKPCMFFCPQRDNSFEYRCDKCEAEVDSEDLYEYDGKEICKDCLLEVVPKAY